MTRRRPTRRIGRQPSDFADLVVNNIKGANSIDLSIGGVVRQRAVAYGDFQAAIWPSSAKGIGMTLSGEPNAVIFSDTNPLNNPPGVDELDCFGGHYPGDWDTHTSPYTSALNTVSFLQGLSDAAGNGGPSPSFNTFLAALQTTGLRDLLTSGGPYMLFPPSDAAFAALPPDQRAALLADPTALAAVLRSLIVDGYYPPESLMGGPYHAHRTVTNLLGQPLELQSGGTGFKINGVIVGNDDYAMTANGSRVFFGISKVLLPAEATPSPTPVPPTATAAPPTDTPPPTATLPPTSSPVPTAPAAPPTSAPLPPTATLRAPNRDSGAADGHAAADRDPRADRRALPPAPPPGMPTTGAGGGPADLLAVLGAALAVLLAGGLLRRRGVARRSGSG